jgi:hypothetical protein
MQMQISVCPEFWKDVKFLKRKLKIAELESTLDAHIFQSADDEEKVESVLLIQLITNIINNAVNDDVLDAHADKHNKQPFLNDGWTVYKMRYATGREGKSGGLRIIFCIDNNEDNVLLVFIARKADCSDEAKLIRKFKKRIGAFIVP